MNFRVLVAVILVVILPIAIGLAWLLAYGTDFSLLGFALFLALAIVIMSLMQAIRSDLKRSWREHMIQVWRHDIEEFEEGLKTGIVSCSSACDKCGSLACPVLNSQNRYCCSKCGRDFAGTEHGLIDLDEFKRRNPAPSEDMPYPFVNP